MQDVAPMYRGRGTFLDYRNEIKKQQRATRSSSASVFLDNLVAVILRLGPYSLPRVGSLYGGISRPYFLGGGGGSLTFRVFAAGGL